MLATVLALSLAAAQAAPAGGPGNRRELLSWSTSYCYPDQPQSITIPDPQCAGGLPTTAPACTVGWAPSESSPVCALGDNTRGVDSNRWEASYQFDYCPDSVVYVMADSTKHAFCKRLQTTGDWSGRVRPADKKDEKYTSGWWAEWFCRADPSWSWVDGRCMSNTRYLGEKCWDGGECNNEGVDQYAETHMSCVSAPGLGVSTPTCLPSAAVLDVERNQCQCGWFDHWYWFACGASGGSCNGHSCVLSTQNGNYYCDYQTDNDW